MWKTIPGFNGEFEASKGGLIRRKKDRVMRKQQLVNGYLRVYIKNLYMAHRLVYEAHCGKIPKGKVINHINGIRSDNRICNLEAISIVDNVRHGFLMGCRRVFGRRFYGFDFQFQGMKATLKRNRLVYLKADNLRRSNQPI